MNKNITIFLIICLLFFLTTSQISAQVEINEVVSDNDPEWIELYNTTLENVSLDKCELRMQDNPDTNQKITFGSGDNINQFLVIHKGDYNWSSNWLNNAGDKIVLTCLEQEKSVAYGNASGAVVEAPDQGKSIGRSPDGTGSFYVLNSPTEGLPNSIPPTPTDSPVSTSTNTPTPTKTPTPTSVPSATKTPTPKPTVKIVNTPTSTPKLLSRNTTSTVSSKQDTVGQVLGQQESSEASSSSSENTNLISGAKISLVLGLLFCGIAIMIFTQRFQEMKKPNEKT